MSSSLLSESETSWTSVDWLPVAFGLLCLYVPTYISLYQVFWRAREGEYGPIILSMVLWLIWRERQALKLPKDSSTQVFGWALFAIGLICFVLGRSQSFYNLEVASQVPLLLGTVALIVGKPGMRRLWTPIVLLVFTVPIPGSLLDQILLPLKELVSRVADDALYFAGYPIARSGVVLIIGPYSLLIADACAGLNSIIAISGIGVIYVHAMRHSRAWINAILLLSTLPIAVFANVARVIGLALVTYYLGDSAGTAFHDRAGYLEIAVAFGSFFALDAVLRVFDNPQPTRT